MEDFDDQYDQLFMEAWVLPNNAEKIERIEQLIALSDENQNLLRGYESRQLLMNTALETGDSDKLLVAFSWCASMSEQRSDIFHGNEILWEYRWVVSELPNFPDVSRDKIEAMMDDMEARYRAADSQLRAFHLMKLFTFAKMGDFAAAEESCQLFEAAPRDWLSDSPRLERNFLVFYHAIRGEYEKAFAISESVLRGEVDDPGFFGQDSAELLMPLLEVGRVADAIRVQMKGYPHVAEHSSWLWNIAQHIEFLARTNQFDSALSIVKEHVTFALKTPRLIYRFFFLRSLWILGERLNHVADAALILKFDNLLRRQSTFKKVDDSLTVTLWNEITQLAERFDRRNGNDFFMKQLNKVKTASTLPNPAGSAS